MKKIIFVLILFLSCYFIYNVTNERQVYYLSLGDFLAKGNISKETIGYGYSLYLKDYLSNSHYLEDYNDTFTNSDYRITDLVRMIKYNEHLYQDNKEVHIAQLIKKADIITLSVGMNELYYKLYINKSDIYTYIHEMLDDMEELLDDINKISTGKVFVLGYYNITEDYNDIFNYINYELKVLVKEKNFIFVDVDNLFSEKEKYLSNNRYFYPNNEGYYKIYQFIVEKM